VLLTRGDCLDHDDAPISADEILGRIVAIERGARRLDPRQTLWQKIGAFIVSRSEFCTRAVLGFRRRAKSAFPREN
jgi:hypothetical protein